MPLPWRVASIDARQWQWLSEVANRARTGDSCAVRPVRFDWNRLFVTVCDSSALVPCYDEFNGRVRPEAGLRH